MPDKPADRAPSPAQTAAAISAAVAALLRDYTGHEPSNVRTTIDDNTIVVAMRGSLTKAERTLAQRGQAAEVLGLRRAYQLAMRDNMIAVVERLTGRSVDAFLSDHLHDPDAAINVFLMHPTASDTPARPDG